MKKLKKQKVVKNKKNSWLSSFFRLLVAVGVVIGGAYAYFLLKPMVS